MPTTLALANPGSLAIGHTRYSTTGDSALLNAQPILVECEQGLDRAWRTTAIMVNALSKCARSLDQSGIDLPDQRATPRSSST
jgi:glutamine phosphoribosylpyrophosphate amidotransferase